jgi:hypothetical protein
MAIGLPRPSPPGARLGWTNLSISDKNLADKGPIDPLDHRFDDSRRSESRVIRGFRRELCQFCSEGWKRFGKVHAQTVIQARIGAYHFYTRCRRSRPAGGSGSRGPPPYPVASRSGRRIMRKPVPIHPFAYKQIQRHGAPLPTPKAPRHSSGSRATSRGPRSDGHRRVLGRERRAAEEPVLDRVARVRHRRIRPRLMQEQLIEE